MNEKRRSRRLRAEIPVRYRLPGEPAFTLARATGVDMSLGGVRLLLEGSPGVGARLDMRIDLPGTGKALDVAGEVVWQRMIAGGACEAGVKFGGLTAEDASAFTDFVFSQMHKRVGR